MANRALYHVVSQLRRLALIGAGSDLTDGHLLGRFIEVRDELAFETLLRRHGPMVLNVCRRILRNPADAEDAFQATFLVLVRKAASIRPREMVGNWLFGVARQTAIRVKGMEAKRRLRERQLANLIGEPEGDRRDDMAGTLHDEVSRLPEKHRIAIVLCDLEGRSRKDVARQLGWAEGTLSSRLARGQALLAKRLAQHGPVGSGEALALALSPNGATAFLPPSLLSTTVKAATVLAAGQPAAAALVSANVAAITQGVLKTMFLTKLKMAAVVSVAMCVLGAGVAGNFLAGQTTQEGQLPTERKTAVEVNNSQVGENTNPRADKIADLATPAGNAPSAIPT